MDSIRIRLTCLGLLVAGFLTGTRAASASPQVGPSLDREMLWLKALGSQPLATRHLSTQDPYVISMGAGQLAWIRLLNASSSEYLPAPGSGGTKILARIQVPATGDDELFTIYVPATPVGDERPLLTCFHAYGTSHGDIAVNTTFLREAETRGWFMIAPLQYGGTQTDPNRPSLWDKNFGSARSQVQVETLIRFMLQRYSIDRDRIYGVGFSMGGGSAMTYAARHRDRRRGAFAAVLNHTGSVALSHAYENSIPPPMEDPIARWAMEDIFGGDPTQTPFEWTRASSIILDSAGALVPGADHMAWNLSRTPVRSVYGVGDVKQYLVDQTLALDTFFQGIPGSMHSLQALAVPTTFPMGHPCTEDLHCWQTLDEIAACDWLAMHTLDANSASGTVLADRSGRWERFDVEQTAANDFSRFDFEIDVPANRLSLAGLENVKTISVGLDDVQLDSAAPFQVVIDLATPNGSDITIRSVPSVPVSVWRTAPTPNLLAQDCTGSTTAPTWCYFAPDQELWIFEPGGSGPATWQVTL